MAITPHPPSPTYYFLAIQEALSSLLSYQVLLSCIVVQFILYFSDHTKYFKFTK